jgi:hypothetical protein
VNLAGYMAGLPGEKYKGAFYFCLQQGALGDPASLPVRAHTFWESFIFR